MLEIGVQTHNIVTDENPEAGFRMMKAAGFDCADFSLNMYLKNTDVYQDRLNGFFDQSIDELKAYFTPHVEAAKKCGIRIHQMHMPYPNWIPTAKDHVNDYLLHEMAPKSMQLSEFLGCRYIVVHGLKVKDYYGTEEAEWEADVIVKVPDDTAEKITATFIDGQRCLLIPLEGNEEMMINGEKKDL